MDTLVAENRTILHLGKFYPPHSGGMETYLHNLATRQATTARVHVIVANKGRRNAESVADGVTVKRVGRVATVASMPVCPGLIHSIRGCPADLVHLHTPNPGAAWAFLMSGHPGRVVITHHADTVGRRILRKFSDPFVNRLMKRADKIIVTSARYLDSSLELTPFREKCLIIPIGIEIQNAALIETATFERLRKQFGEKLLLAVGRLVPYKGFETLIRAMKAINGHLLLIGTGPQRKFLMELIAAEGLKTKVSMLGHVDNLAPYFAAASVFVLPSLTRAEAFGIVQLEAMAAGLPVINTDLASGVPEICPHGKTGITVPPGDPFALAQAAQMLLESKNLRLSYGEAGRIRVKAEYTADLMTRRILSAYSEVLDVYRFTMARA